MWKCLWKRTNLLLFLTHIHDDVWLPFMLSMSLVFFIVVWGYMPKDTKDTGQRSYIPKRHRKWARFRSKWIKQATTASYDSVIGRSIAAVWKTATKSSFSNKREFRRCRATLLSKTTRTGAKVVQTIIRQTSILVNENEDAPSGQEIIQCALIPLISTRMSSKGEQYRLTIFAAYLYFCGLQCYDNEMKGKTRTLKKLVETSTATSRGAVSLSTWIDIAVTSFDLFSEHVECCEITRAATITYVVAGGLTIMQNCLSCSYAEVDKAGRKEEADDDDNYYDCCQSHEEQINAELETLTFMPATLPNKGHNCLSCSYTEDDDASRKEEVDNGDNYYDCCQSHEEQVAVELETLMFMPATLPNKGHNDGQPDLGFDSDSYWMAVYNCCSACISNCLADFVGPTRQVITKVKGIGSISVMATKKGVLRWRITDNDGKIHTFLIKGAYYHESSPYRLLSPQHLAQVCYDNKFHRSILVLSDSNSILLRSAPGYDAVAAFYTQIEELNGEEILTWLPAVSVADNEQSDSDNDEMDPDETRREIVEQEADRLQGKTRRHPDLPDDIFTDKRAMSQTDFLAWHQIHCIAYSQALFRIQSPAVRQGSHQAHNRVVSTAPRLACSQAAFRVQNPAFHRVHCLACSQVLFRARNQVVGRASHQVRDQVHNRVVSPATRLACSQASSRVQNSASHRVHCLACSQILFRVQSPAVRQVSHQVHNRVVSPAPRLVCSQASSRVQNPAFHRVHCLACSQILFRAQNQVVCRASHQVHDQVVSPVLCLVCSKAASRGQSPAFHYRLGHGSWEKIRQLSAHGDLPASFRNGRVPKGAAGLFGKARRRAWQSKAPGNNMKTPPATAPGSVVAMDQMVSALPGCIAQMRGFLTGKRYKVITVFVDQFSVSSFVYIQKSTTAEETVQAKVVFGRYARTHGVTVKHYHADHGIFAEAEFVRAVEKASQTISFCGVNAHHMNGHAEKRIRDLQENARARLLHAKRRWQSAMTAHLWPYAVRMANEVHNFAPSIKEGISPIERFSQVRVSPKVRHCHILGLADGEVTKTARKIQASRGSKAVSAAAKGARNSDVLNELQQEGVPQGTQVLPSAWERRRKRRISTQEVYKWKARLSPHGGKQECGWNYWETYSPEVTWATVRLFLVLVLLNKWPSRQVVFVLVYPQADIECPMYVEIPSGFQTEGSRKKNCLLLGQTDIDEAYKLLSAPGVANQGEVLHRAFIMTDEGELSDYSEVKIDALPNGTIKVSQPHLIQSVWDDIKVNERTGTKKTPASTAVKLNRDIHGEPVKENWPDRGIIGKLSFIEKSPRPDIVYSVHQCARFYVDPKNSHATAVRRSGKYRLATKDKGMILNPKSQSVDCWVNADSVGNWDRVYTDVDPGTAKSKEGYIINYGECTIIWGSKVMQEGTLSTDEAEYGAISMSLRYVIFLMQLIEETAKELKWETSKTVPKVHGKLFEDKSGALEMARLPKMRPRTKHLCVKMHQFREHVRKGKVSILKIPTRFQLGDIATKARPEALFVSQRESLLQWEAETMTRKELTLPAKHLRACDISDSSEALCVDQHANAFRAASKPTPVVIDPATVKELISRVRRTQARVDYFKAVDKPMRAFGSQKASASTGKAISSTAMATASTAMATASTAMATASMAMAKASTIKASKKTTMIPPWRGGK